jgi:pimeloyl-ACP methyl ester carboxylesterase
MRVIAVHGAAVNGATWMPLERILPASVGFIADDLPGHGERREEPFDFASAVGGVVAAARSAGPRTVLVGDSLGGYLVLAAGAQLGDAIAGVVAGSCTFAMRGLAGAVARISLVPGMLIPPGAVRTLVYRICDPDVARAIEARGFAPAMRNVTMRSLLGHDVLADVRAIRAPITFIVGSWDVPIVWNAARFSRAAVAGRVIVERNAPHGVGILRPAAFAGAIASMQDDASTDTESRPTW